MDTSIVPLKCCSRKEKCIHPEARDGWLPETADYFMPHKGKFYSQCHECRREAKRQAHVRHREYNNERSRRWASTHVEQVHQAYLKRAEDPAFMEKSRQRAAEWAHNNPDKVKARTKKNYWADPQRQKDAAKQWRKNHPDQAREQVRRWRRVNRERHNANCRNWSKNHPIENRAHTAKRRALKVKNGGAYSAADVQLQIKAQTNKLDKLHCWWCGEVIDGDAYHVDHRIPLARGGSNAPENLCISCPSCNLSKGGKLPQEWNGRLL